jgi:hypothetical protein
MNTIEEQLWNYIDGNCNASEQAEIKTKIATDLQFQSIYHDLLAVHQELNILDLEEPSLSFTRNIMERVDLELRPVALKTKIDNRIIYGIGSFFLISILGILGYAISISNLDFNFTLPKLALPIETSKLFNPNFIQLFVLFDVALGLIYLDSYLRRGRNTEKKAER